MCVAVCLWLGKGFLFDELKVLFERKVGFVLQELLVQLQADVLALGFG